MAITAAMTLSSATSTAPGQVTAICTITNNNATDANVLSVDPQVTAASGATTQSCAVQAGVVGLGPGATVRVAASGTLALTFVVQAFAPFKGTTSTDPAPADFSSAVYTIGALIRTNASGTDASVAASTTTLTTSPPASH